MKIIKEKSFKNILLTALKQSVLHSTAKKVLFIDCANAFDPYKVLQLSNNRLKAKKALGNIMISRPFTIFQLKRLIEKDVLKESKKADPSLLVFFGITQMFLDDDIKIEERKAVLLSIAKSIHSFRNFKVQVYLTENSLTDYFMGELNGKNSKIV